MKIALYKERTDEKVFCSYACSVHDSYTLCLYGEKLSGDELKGVKTVAEFIRKNRGSTSEDICAGTGLSYQETVACIGMLESDGIISTDLLQRCSIINKIL